MRMNAGVSFLYTAIGRGKRWRALFVALFGTTAVVMTRGEREDAPGRPAVRNTIAGCPDPARFSEWSL